MYNDGRFSALLASIENECRLVLFLLGIIIIVSGFYKLSVTKEQCQFISRLTRWRLLMTIADFSLDLLAALYTPSVLQLPENAVKYKKCMISCTDKKHKNNATKY